jgi:hypothetical protein
MGRWMESSGGRGYWIETESLRQRDVAWEKNIRSLFTNHRFYTGNTRGANLGSEFRQYSIDPKHLKIINPNVVY